MSGFGDQLPYLALILNGTSGAGAHCRHTGPVEPNFRCFVLCGMGGARAKMWEI